MCSQQDEIPAFPAGGWLFLHEGAPAGDDGDHVFLAEQRQDLASRGAGDPVFLHQPRDARDAVPGPELPIADTVANELSHLPVRRYRGAVVNRHALTVGDRGKQQT